MHQCKYRKQNKTWTALSLRRSYNAILSMSQECTIGFISGDIAYNSVSSYSFIALVRWGRASSSVKLKGSSKAASHLPMWECRMSVRYFSLHTVRRATLHRHMYSERILHQTILSRPKTTPNSKILQVTLRVLKFTAIGELSDLLLFSTALTALLQIDGISQYMSDNSLECWFC